MRSSNVAAGALPPASGRVHEGGCTIHLDIRTGLVTATRPDGTPYEIPPSRAWIGPSTRAA